MVSNEVYTGAGASATLIPEADYDIGMQLGTRTISGTTKKGFSFENSQSGTIDYTTISWGSDANSGGAVSDSNRLPTDIYKGCLAEVTVYPHDSSTPKAVSYTHLRAHET